MAENKKLITADNSFLTYMGRIDFSDKTRPEFYYAGSNVKMTFTGTSVSAVIKNHKYFNIQELGFVMDGMEQLGRVPVEGDHFVYETLDVTVTRVEHQRILEIRVFVLPKSESET